MQIFSRNPADGFITPVESVAVGDSPYHVHVSNDDEGARLVVALWTGDAIKVFSRDRLTGKLTPLAGQGYELDAIASVVIGGTSLAGGVGGVGGTILGALLMGVISSGLDMLNVPSYYQQVVKGLIIIGAVMLDRRDSK